MVFHILNVTTSSISDVKKSPSFVFKRAEEKKTPVYVFNRGEVAGVMLTQDQYESLVKENDLLQEKIFELVAEKRLLINNLKTYSDAEARGSITDEPVVLDEQDGWE